MFVDVHRSESHPMPEAGHAEIFATTHWSVVLLAGQANSPGATDALEIFCRTYWT